MSDLREASEMALEFVDWLCGDDHSIKPKNKALDVREALRQALAQPEQKREWVGLTDEEIEECKIDGGLPHTVNWRLSTKVMQAKLKEKNT